MSNAEGLGVLDANGEDDAEKHAVGDAEGEELSVPCAPADARPERDMQSYTPRSDASGLPHELPELSVPKTPAAQPLPPPSKTDAYENYKVGPGAELFKALTENKSTVKERKKKSKELANKINATKHEMDELRVRVDEIREAHSPQPNNGNSASAPGEAEIACLMRMKDLKKQYRDAYEELKMIKSEIDYTSRLVEECTMNMLSEFEKWFTEKYGVAVMMSDGPPSPADSTPRDVSRTRTPVSLPGMDLEDDNQHEFPGPTSDDPNEAAWLNSKRDAAKLRKPQSKQAKKPMR